MFKKVASEELSLGIRANFYRISCQTKTDQDAIQAYLNEYEATERSKLEDQASTIFEKMLEAGH